MKGGGRDGKLSTGKRLMKPFVMMGRAARRASLSRTPSDALRGAADERRRLDGKIFLLKRLHVAAESVCHGGGIFFRLMKHFTTNK